MNREKLIAKANQYFGQGRYEEAVLNYLEAIARTPEIAESVMLNIKLAQERAGHKIRINEIDENTYLKTNFGDLSLSNVRVNAAIDYEGRIDAASAHGITGWAVYKQSRTAVFEMNVIVNGLEYVTVKNNFQRADLKRVGKSKGLGGFELKFPKGLLDNGENTVSIVLPDGKTLSKKVVVNERQPVNSSSYFKGVTSLSIVVPIYNALADVKRCVARLSLYTPDKVRVFLINDGSSDPEIKRFLNNYVADPRFIINHNDENLGFTKTVNIGIELAGMDDVIILNSDARVTPRWVEAIVRAADSDPRVATVTPMSDRAGAFSAPRIGNENDLPDGVDEESYAVAFRRRGYGYYPVVPTGNGYCMFIRRSCILDIGLLDEVAFPKGYGEENDLCMRARENGWINIIDDRTYIFHDRNKSFGEKKNELVSHGRKVLDERYPDYGKAIQTFSVSPLIAAARFKAKQAMADLVEGVGQIKPRVLFVVSTLTGGTPQTNRDLMLALSDRIEPWLLHCDSQTVSMYRVLDVDNDVLERRHELSESVEPITHVSAEYDRVVGSWLLDLDCAVVHIRHLAWHSMNLPLLAKRAGAKVVASFHDFYAVCPTVKLLDENNVFCNGVCTSSRGDCTIDLWKDKSALPSLKGSWVYRWRDKFRDKVLPYSDVFITTHDSVKETYLDIFGPLNNFHVIPHGRDFQEFLNVGSSWDVSEKIRILVPGSVTVAKGGDIIREVANQHKNMEFHILGNLKHKGSDNVIVHGRYQRDDFQRKVKDIDPHIGLVMSIWNETWCHTLTEMWSVGLPVVVSKFKTLEQRVQATGGGWVSDPSAAGLAATLDYILNNPEEMVKKKRSVLSWQEGGGRRNNTSAMADKYYNLYEKMFSGKYARRMI